MSAFFKTLFGDVYNLLFVAAVVGVVALMIHLDLTKDAVYVMPAMLLIGAGGFARR